jgi:hypothetical protein
MKVNLMIIGAMKSGTTTLSRILEKHPEVTFCTKKEPDFFSTNKDWKKNITSYHDLFDHNKNARIIAEGSTSYTKYPEYNLEIWNDIHEYNEKMKFIYIVRNPFDRIISHYMHAFERGYINDSIDDAIINYSPLIINSRYFTQIKPYIDAFGRNNVLIIDFSDFLSMKEQILFKIAEFLHIDVDLFKDFRNIHANASTGTKNKIHHTLDFLNGPVALKLRRGIRFVLPDKMRSRLWDFIITNKSQEIGKKPILKDRQKNIIINMLYLEVKELGKLINKDLLNLWFNKVS